MKKKTVRRRRGNPVNTQARILAAAQSRFAAFNYENVGLRDIARDAGVDVALIGRYFESKQNLFSIVLKRLVDPELLTLVERATFGKRVARALLSGEMDEGDLTPIMLIVRGATSATAKPILQDISAETFMAPFARWLGGRNAEIRAQFIAAMIGGAAIYKEFLPKSLSSKAGKKKYERELAAALQAYVDG